MLGLVVMLLLTNSLALSQGLDLQPYPQTKKDAIAESLKEGEICRRNLVDTKEALHECSVQAGDSTTGIHVLGGFIGGVVVTFLVCSVAHVCN